MCVYICMYRDIDHRYVCMYVCTYVCMCMHACIHTHIHIQGPIPTNRSIDLSVDRCIDVSINWSIDSSLYRPIYLHVVCVCGNDRADRDLDKSNRVLRYVKKHRDGNYSKYSIHYCWLFGCILLAGVPDEEMLGLTAGIMCFGVNHGHIGGKRILLLILPDPILSSGALTETQSPKKVKPEPPPL